MLNEATIIGNLGRDPEVRHTQAGQPIVNLNVATTEKWTAKGSGEKKERTEWHRVVIFNERLGEVAQKYLRKGSRVFLRGQLQTRRWQDQSGADRYSTEIVLGQHRGELVLLGGTEPREEAEPAGGGDMEDSIPFAAEVR